MTQGEAMQSGWSLQQAAVVGAAFWLLVAMASVLLASGPVQAGMLVGTVTGGLAGLIGFLFLARMRGRPMGTAIGAMAGGFVARMLLVVVGMVLTLRTFEGNAFGFVGTFFVLFFAFVALEFAVLVGGGGGPVR